jgi:hypothetical protein
MKNIVAVVEIISIDESPMGYIHTRLTIGDQEKPFEGVKCPEL